MVLNSNNIKAKGGGESSRREHPLPNTSTVCMLVASNRAHGNTEQCRTQGGAKGAHAPPPPPPPRSDRKSCLAPGKKTIKVKRHAKNWYKCESNTCTFTECKNGRALVKYGNLRLLIRDQTTPHCDARNSKCQIEL